MKPINLRPHEARRLAEAGEVLVIRPAKDGPDDYPGLFGDGSAKLFETHTEGPFPFPGATAWGREAWFPDPPQDGSWDYHGYTDGVIRLLWAIPKRLQTPKHVIYRASWDGPSLAWMSSTQMPRWASRFPRLTIASRRFCRLSGLDDNDRKQTRVCRPDDPANLKLHLVDLVEFEEDWDLYNPKHPAASDPWVWAALLRMED